MEIMTYKKLTTLLTTTILAAVVLSMLVPPSVLAQSTSAIGGTVASKGPLVAKPSVLSLAPSFIIPNAQFVQAGVGLRNVGHGEIAVHAPTGTTAAKAMLYWTIIASGT